MPKIIIAIDGLSSSGKSTLAKRLAGELDYGYVDSGAFYRAVTHYLFENRINWKNSTELLSALNHIDLKFKYSSSDKQSRVFVNDVNAEPEIRSISISNLVSEVSAIPEVRKFINSKLKPYGNEKGVVMDGRDIGTVVFPEAELKVYMTAQERIRSDRRFNELKNKGIEVTQSEIKKNLSDRDLTDSTRGLAPLKAAPDAIILDNSEMTETEQFEFVLELARQRINQANGI